MPIHSAGDLLIEGTLNDLGRGAMLKLIYREFPQCLCAGNDPSFWRDRGGDAYPHYQSLTDFVSLDFVTDKAQPLLKGVSDRWVKLLPELISVPAAGLTTVGSHPSNPYVLMINKPYE
ncbi:hypothetical protein ACLOJK_027884 [Asimina triloba]